MPLTGSDIRALHQLVMRRSAPGIAGQYASQGLYINTSRGRHMFPPAVEIPDLMGDFSAWLAAARLSPDAAFTAHLRLVTIHPFDDGNGRTARLLMNLVLIRGGYPPVAVRPGDRLAYLEALERAQAGEGSERFETLLYQRLDTALDEYLGAVNAARPLPIPS